MMASTRSLILLVIGCICFFLSVQLLLDQCSSNSSWSLWPRPLSWISFGRFRDTPFPPTSSRQAASGENDVPFLLGAGKADITGPVVEVEFMGFANRTQIGSGLRQRLYARTFIVASADSPQDRVVYVVLDIQSGDTAVRNGILESLAALGDDYQVYGRTNVAITGTHSHSGPGAWLNYLLPTITSNGFSQQSYQAIVDGAVLSIRRAHESLTEGVLSIGTTNLTDASVNRSKFAYLANPAAERAQYDADVDQTMTVLRFQRASDFKTIGILTWFPVHPVSMLGNNTLVTGDNKGLAAYLFEQSVRSEVNATDDFVATFSQANVGDTSPNTEGAWCEDGSNEPCSFERSTCNGKSTFCHGRGPRFREDNTGTASCYEIARRQFQAARSLYDQWETRNTALTGSTVRSYHTFQDMRNFTFVLPNGTIARTCAAALGYSFAAGTTDWPGSFDFKQGDSGDDGDASPLWKIVRSALRSPSEDQKACQAPKPVLLDVGEMDRPYAWTPNVVDMQMLRIGNLMVIISPGEATTMAGRRWRHAISKHALHQTDIEKPHVVLGGPANSYTHYLATDAEYDVQRYEGASTLYGRHTLDAYINLTTTYLPYLAHSLPRTPLPPGPTPPDNRDKAISLIRGVVFDAAPFGKAFGDIVADVHPVISLGATVQASFVGANPRNDLRLEATYAAVERRDIGTGFWKQIRNDADWELVFRWRRVNSVLGTSEVSIEWQIPTSTPPGEHDLRDGVYRLRYYGTAKRAVTGPLQEFEGISGAFRIA